MGFIADKVQAWKDHRAAIEYQYIAEGALNNADLSGNEEIQQRAQQGLADAQTRKREAADRFWGRLVR